MYLFLLSEICMVAFQRLANDRRLNNELWYQRGITAIYEHSWTCSWTESGGYGKELFAWTGYQRGLIEMLSSWIGWQPARNFCLLKNFSDRFLHSSDAFCLLLLSLIHGKHLYKNSQMQLQIHRHWQDPFPNHYMLLYGIQREGFILDLGRKSHLR